MERNLLKEDENVRKELEILQKNIVQIKTEKEICDYLFKKFKSLIPDETIVKTLDDAVNINIEIGNLEREKTELQIKVENTSLQLSLGEGNILENRRKLESYKEELREVINNLEILFDRRKSLENEIMQIEIREKKKFEKLKDLERQNQAVILNLYYYNLN